MTTTEASEPTQPTTDPKFTWGYRERGQTYVHITSEEIARRVVETS